MTPLEGYGPETPVVKAAKPLRADARRNRARVLEAADEVFAAKGISASTEEIARHAKVGVGTVFRHFPTKETLLEAVLVGRFGRLAQEARGLTGAEEPAVVLFDFLARIVDQSATKNAFAGALTAAGVDVENSVADVGRELWSALEILLTRAQRTGAVRGDVRVGELIALIVGASRAAEYADRDPEIRARTVAVIFDGLRTSRPA
ncbi:MAG TPA: helix-turn-helix domain-containing protein [Rugosimonospora sp.]